MRAQARVRELGAGETWEVAKTYRDRAHRTGGGTGGGRRSQPGHRYRPISPISRPLFPKFGGPFSGNVGALLRLTTQCILRTSDV
jgi:hypothetical protein